MNNSLADAIQQRIEATGFWNAWVLHVALGHPAEAMLRRKRHKDPRICRPHKVAHVYLRLPIHWDECVGAAGIAVANHAETPGAVNPVFMLAARPMTGSLSDGLDGLWEVVFAATRKRRIVRGEGWLARYGGMNLVSALSASNAVENVQVGFLAGLNVKAAVQPLGVFSSRGHMT